MAWRMIPPVLSPITPLAIASALVPGRHIRGAPERLRELLRERYDAGRVVLTGSGTQALQLAITITVERHGSGTCLALPGYGCYDLASAAVGAGVKVHLYELETTTLGPDFQSLEQALAKGCRAVVIAPLYGVPVDWDRVQDLCDAFGATVIEDAAQGHGAQWKGRPLGSLADLSILSFGRGKGWTGGHGGALLLRGTFGDLAGPKMLPFRNQMAGLVTLTAQWLLTRPSLYRLPSSIPALRLGETRYRDPVPPRAMEPTAAFLIRRNDAASVNQVPVRQRAAMEYDRLFARAGIQTVNVPGGGIRGALRYPLLIPPDQGRILRVHSLGARPGYPQPLANLLAIRPLLSPSGGPPSGIRLAKELVTLPTHSKISPKTQRILVERLRPKE